MTDVTRIVSDIEQGGAQASEQLLPQVYDELWKSAASKMARLSDVMSCFAGRKIRSGRRRRVALVGSQYRKPRWGPRS
jgi:hypothetical protein